MSLSSISALLYFTLILQSDISFGQCRRWLKQFSSDREAAGRPVTLGKVRWEEIFYVLTYFIDFMWFDLILPSYCTACGWVSVTLLIKILTYLISKVLLGSELIPVYRQSTRRWLLQPSPGGILPLLFGGLRSPSQPKNVCPSTSTKICCLVTVRHIGVNNFPTVVVQLCPGGILTHDILIASLMPDRYATAPPTYLLIFRSVSEQSRNNN